MGNRLLLLLMLLVVVVNTLPTLAKGSSLSEGVDLQNKNLNVRAFHFVINNLSRDELYKIIDKVSANNFNTLIIGLYNGVNFKSLSLNKERQQNVLSIKDFLSVVEYAREKELVVIPELKLLTKQQFLMVKYVKKNDVLVVPAVRKLTRENMQMVNSSPDQLYNSVTYNPSYPNIYSDVIFPLLKEIIELIKPQAIHIGHDEAAGINKYSRQKWLNDGREMLPASLFVKDVKTIRDYLAKYNIQTWMWGDMLLGSKEFPSMFQRGGGLNGGSRDYGRKLMAKLPKDVVICDWHYSDTQANFPTLSAFKESDFRVLGATWKKEETIKNFTSYASTHGASGMIATTWIHVQRKEWDIVNRIIKISGAAFNKNFPDEKE